VITIGTIVKILLGFDQKMQKKRDQDMLVLIDWKLWMGFESS